MRLTIHRSMTPLLLMILAITTSAAAVTEAGDAIRQQLLDHDNSRAKLDPELIADPEYRAIFDARTNLFIVVKVKLIGDLWRIEPDAHELLKLMPYRWTNSDRVPDLDIAGEIEDFAALHPEEETSIALGWRSRALNIVTASKDNPERALAAVDQFIDRYPDDNYAADLMHKIAISLDSCDERKIDLLDRIITQYPNSRPGRYTSEQRMRDAAVGKPFELSFTDQLTGDHVDMEHLRGKVVVIRFWSTLCAACKRDLPQVKALYDLHHDAGLEIIGINLDRSTQRMKAFCNEYNMTWPQYNEEGRAFDSEFSRSWGVSFLPMTFIVDRSGILRSVTAYGQLDQLVPELLAEPAPQL